MLLGSQGGMIKKAILIVRVPHSVSSQGFAGDGSPDCSRGQHGSGATLVWLTGLRQCTRWWPGQSLLCAGSRDMALPLPALPLPVPPDSLGHFLTARTQRAGGVLADQLRKWLAACRPLMSVPCAHCRILAAATTAPHPCSSARSLTAASAVAAPLTQRAGKRGNTLPGRAPLALATSFNTAPAEVAWWRMA